MVILIIPIGLELDAESRNHIGHVFKGANHINMLLLIEFDLLKVFIVQFYAHILIMVHRKGDIFNRIFERSYEERDIQVLLLLISDIADLKLITFEYEALGLEHALFSFV